MTNTTNNKNEFKENLNLAETAKHWEPGMVVLVSKEMHNNKEHTSYITVPKKGLKKEIKGLIVNDGYIMEYDKRGILFLSYENDEFKFYKAYVNININDLF